MSQLLVVSNPAKKKRKPAKKKSAIKNKVKKKKKKKVVKKSIKKCAKKTGKKSRTKTMAKKSKAKAKKKNVSKRAPRKTAPAKRRKKRSKSMGIKGALMPAVVGGGGAVMLDVVLALVPLPPMLKTGPGKLLVKGGAAVVGGMLISRMVNKSTGNAFLVGGLTLLSADIAKMALQRFAPDLAMDAYLSYEGDGINEYMSEYMSEYMEDNDDMGYLSTGPITGEMDLDYGESYEQDGLGDFDEAEIVDVEEF